MTFIVVVMLGVAVLFITSALEDVSISDTLRGFLAGEIAQPNTAANNANAVINTAHTATQAQ